MIYNKRIAVVGLSSCFGALLLYHAFTSAPQVRPHATKAPFYNPAYHIPESDIDWSRFAYIQYATNVHHLCNSVMLFERLHSLNSKASRLLLYPTGFSLDREGLEAQFLKKARDQYNAVLQPIEVQRRDGDDPTWAKSYTKLLAFNQTSYTRILHLDSNSTILQSMDELFLLPPSPAAMCRSYWEEQPKLSGQMLLLEPSAHEFARLEKAVAVTGPKDYDMEILNALYRDSALILPHKIYDLYTREFTPQRNTGSKHEKYLGDESAQWDPDTALKTAKFIHFSDWPLPKPWIKPNATLFDEVKPPCVTDIASGGEDCRDRDIWLGFHEDFKRRRKEICGLDPV